MATEPTHVRPYRLDDAEQLYDAIEGSRRLLSVWMPWCTPGYTLETKASLRVTEKAGAHREGVLFDRLSVHGKTYDAAMFSIVRSRFDVQ